jgi:hypothetical protein
MIYKNFAKLLKDFRKHLDENSTDTIKNYNNKLMISFISEQLNKTFEIHIDDLKSSFISNKKEIEKTFEDDKLTKEERLIKDILE